MDRLEQRRGTAEMSAGPLDVVLAAVAVCAFGAVSGIHVLGLMAGRAGMSEVQNLQRMVPGWTVEGAPLPLHVAQTAHLLARLRVVGSTPWLLSLTGLAGLFAALAMVRLLHPGLRAKWAAGEVSGKQLGIAAGFSAAVVVAAFWPLPDSLVDTPAGPVRAALAGALLWLLWHQSGWLHRADQPPSYFRLLWLLIQGAMVGVVAHTFLRHMLCWGDLVVMDQWLPASSVSADAWRQIALYAVGGRAWGGLWVAALAALLAPVGMSWRGRLALAALPFGLAALMLGGGEAWRQRYWIGRFHCGERLRRVVSVHQGPGVELDERWVLVLEHARQMVPGAVSPPFSFVRLPVSEAHTAAVRRFLEGCGSRTTLAFAAYGHLYDAAAWRWDLPAAMQVSAAAQRSPAASPLWGALLIDDLMRCADSRPAEELVDDLVRNPVWDWSGRLRLEKLAALCWRWDRLEDVRGRVAREAPELWANLQQRPPPGHHGVVRGVLQKGGRPWAGVRVGLIRVDDEGSLLVRRLRPWEQRGIVARCETDKEGRFRLTGLFDDRYLLVLSVTAQQLGSGEPLAPSGLAGAIELGPDEQVRDLGVIDLRPWVPGPPAVEARLPAGRRPA